MTPRIQIALAIIFAIAVGSGVITVGVLLAVFGSQFDNQATIIAAGVTILVAGISALIAHAKGCFRDLDDRDI